LLSLLTLAAMASTLFAESPQAPAPAGEQPMPAQTTEIADVVVPVPREIFATLAKFHDSNWRLVQRPQLSTARAPRDQAGIALLLGAVIGEGFIAVEAEDLAEVKKLGRAVLTLSRGLGVEKWALRRSRSIVEHAEQGHWRAGREEWDGLLPDVQQGMNALRSQDLAQLVSLGGWLRGMGALAGLVVQNYTPEDAELLRQPALLDEFQAQLAKIGGPSRSKALLARMREGIVRTRSLVAADENEISPEELQQIVAISDELLKSLTASGKPAEPARRR